jgi:glycosyltransferase involved in cell wall biosynthesis
MKLMVVGHPFMFAYNQKKYVAMKRIDPDLRLLIITPSQGCERFERTECQLHPELRAEEVAPLDVWPRGWHMTHLHNPSRMSRLMREFQPDVIHIDPGEPQALLTVETIALQRKFAPRAAVTLMTVDNIHRRRRFPLEAVKQGLRAYSLPRVSGMIPINRRAAELLRTEGRYKGPIDILPQFGIDPVEHKPGKEPELRASLGLRSGVVVGYVGRLVIEKGIRSLLEALRGLDSYPWKLLFVGGGPLENEIQQKWMMEFPGRIVMVPPVPYGKVAEYLRCLDIFVMASYSSPTLAEQFGVALAQAMTLGIPCIGSSCGAIPEVLGPGGLIAEERNVKELAQNLKILLDSPTLREEFGRSGRAFALEHYAIERVGARYLAAFERARDNVTTARRSHGSNTKVEPVAEKTF